MSGATPLRPHGVDRENITFTLSSKSQTDCGAPYMETLVSCIVKQPFAECRGLLVLKFTRNCRKRNLGLGQLGSSF
jgi:hypothetical protein